LFNLNFLQYFEIPLAIIGFVYYVLGFSILEIHI